MSSDFAFSPAGVRPANLRLFSGPAEEEDAPRPDSPAPLLTPKMRVEEFWDRYVLPVVAQACNWSKGTLASYAEGVDYWTELTRDRSIEAIDGYETATFVSGLRMQPGRAAEFMSTASIRKHCATVQRILQIAGPKQRRSKKDLRRFGAALIADVPWIEAPDPDDLLPDGDFTHAEVLAILGACSKMTRPRTGVVSPEQWWKALVQFLCATGLRIGTAMQLEWGMISEQMLLIPGAITKKKKPFVQYLHPSIKAVIAPLRGASPRVFAWKNYPRPGAVRSLQRHREKLMERAGLPEERRFGFHGFRKYHATELFEAAGVETAQASLNHGNVATTLQSYVNHRSQLEARVRQQQAGIDQMRLLRDV